MTPKTHFFSDPQKSLFRGLKTQVKVFKLFSETPENQKKIKKSLEARLIQVQRSKKNQNSPYPPKMQNWRTGGSPEGSFFDTGPLFDPQKNLKNAKKTQKIHFIHLGSQKKTLKK